MYKENVLLVQEIIEIIGLPTKSELPKFQSGIFNPECYYYISATCRFSVLKCRYIWTYISEALALYNMASWITEVIGHIQAEART